MQTDIAKFIPWVVQKASDWGKEQEAKLLGGGKIIDPRRHDALKRFFDPEILESARIVLVPEIPNPPFYAELRRQGLPVLDFSRMIGLTLGKCVLIRERFGVSDAAWDALYFHELVHVVQYNILGIDEFMNSYVRGWADNGYDYERIPHEIVARSLEQKYLRSPDVAFSVRQKVIEGVQGRFDQ